MVSTYQLQPGRSPLLCNNAFFTMVALDEAGTPCAVPPLSPVTEFERQLVESAAHRRAVRLKSRAAEMSPKSQ